MVSCPFLDIWSSKKGGLLKQQRMVSCQSYYRSLYFDSKFPRFCDAVDRSSRFSIRYMTHIFLPTVTCPIQTTHSLNSPTSIRWYRHTNAHRSHHDHRSESCHRPIADSSYCMTTIAGLVTGLYPSRGSTKYAYSPPSRMPTLGSVSRR